MGPRDLAVHMQQDRLWCPRRGASQCGCRASSPATRSASLSAPPGRYPSASASPADQRCSQCQISLAEDVSERPLGTRDCCTEPRGAGSDVESLVKQAPWAHRLAPQQPLRHQAMLLACGLDAHLHANRQQRPQTQDDQQRASLRPWPRQHPAAPPDMAGFSRDVPSASPCAAPAPCG